MATVGMIALILAIGATKIIATGCLLAIGFALGKMLIEKISSLLKARKAMNCEAVTEFVNRFAPATA